MTSNRAMTPGRAYALALVLMAAGLIALVLAYALPWLTVVALVGVIATRSWGRTLVAWMLVLAAIAGVIVSVLPGRLSALGLVGGGLLAVGAAWTALRGQRWPVMGARYEAGDSSRRAKRTLTDWEAQDRGLDPTADPAPGSE